jgi:hypothetical protein
MEKFSELANISFGDNFIFRIKGKPASYFKRWCYKEEQ